MANLAGKCVAILATSGYEDSELAEPHNALLDNGAEVEIVSTKSGMIEGENGHKMAVDSSTKKAKAEDYDALVLPGGVMNADKIRLDSDAVSFTRAFFDQRKPVAAICHGGWILADADVLRGRRVTSFPSLKTDLQNAGAEWLDEEVVSDNGLVTSGTPDGLLAFTRKLIEELGDTHRDA